MEYFYMGTILGYRVIYQLRDSNIPCFFRSKFQPLAECVANKLREAGESSFVSDPIPVTKTAGRFYLQDFGEKNIRIPDPFQGIGFN
jgi:hypothetical protein